MGLRKLVGSGPVALDTAVFIYFVEQHPTYAKVVRPLFVAADRGQLELVTSAVTLLEVQVVPYRAGNAALAEHYEALLMRSRGLTLIDLDREVLRTAAQLRARFGIRTPDALQLAAAHAARCTVFVTNDRRLPAVEGLRIVQLSEVVAHERRNDL